MIRGLTLICLLTSSAAAQTGQPKFGPVQCDGAYKIHLQGICTNEKDAIYWCFTDVLIKTDVKGKIQKKVPVKFHHGDLCHQDGKIYVAVNLTKFSEPTMPADSWVYVYDANDLAFLRKHEVKEVVFGAGGMTVRDGRFFIIGGLPKGTPENYVYEYDRDFKFTKRHILKSGYTEFGIQTAAFINGHFWFGCYGNKLLKTDADLKLIGTYDFDCSLGIVGTPDGRILVARGVVKGRPSYTGSLVFAEPDDMKGLVVKEK